jgi:hypothetical protein
MFNLMLDSRTIVISTMQTNIYPEKNATITYGDSVLQLKEDAKKLRGRKRDHTFVQRDKITGEQINTITIDEYPKCFEVKQLDKSENGWQNPSYKEHLRNRSNDMLSSIGYTPIKEEVEALGGIWVPDDVIASGDINDIDSNNTLIPYHHNQVDYLATNDNISSMIHPVRNDPYIREQFEKLKAASTIWANKLSLFK